jgi:arginase family enzyme
MSRNDHDHAAMSSLGDALEATVVRLPGLEDRPHGEGLWLHNRLSGRTLEVGPEAKAALAFFARPRRLRELFESELATPPELMLLLETLCLGQVDMMMTPVASGIAAPLSSWMTGEAHHDFAIFGAPVDCATASAPGARHGPRFIREVPSFAGVDGPEDGSAFGRPGLAATAEAEFVDLEFRRHYRRGARVVDLGDVRYMPGESITSYGARIGFVAGAILRAGARPVMLGGDHSVTHFVLSALVARGEPFGIVHFDAHHDVTPPPLPEMNVVWHGNPFWAVLESPLLKRLFQIGLRTFDRVAPGSLRRDDRVQYRSAREVHRMTVEQVFEGLPDDLPYYLSFDVDVVQPEVAPETGTPVGGGLSYYQAVELVDFAARRFEIVGADFVEVGGDRRGGAARVTSHCLTQVLFSRSPFEPLGNHLQAWR